MYQTTCPKQQYEWEKTYISENNSPLVRWHLLFGTPFCLCGAIQGRSAEPDEAGAVNESSVDVGTEFLIKPAANLINPTFTLSGEATEGQLDWCAELSPLEFLAVEHAFRLATEKGTREGMSQIPRGYLNAESNSHGWSERAIPFDVRPMLGHPMQGAIAGYIWAQNHTRYLHVDFGAAIAPIGKAGCARRRSPGRTANSLRSDLCSSEASIGGIQALYPATGLCRSRCDADHRSRLDDC